LNERETAVRVLTRITKDAAYNNIALRGEFAAAKGMNTWQKAFVTEIVNGTLRNLILIDRIIESLLKTPEQVMDPYTRNILRTGVYQIFWMDRVPVSAAVNEAVTLAKARGGSRLAAFVNAVLRSVVRTAEGADSTSSPMERKSGFPYNRAQNAENKGDVFTQCPANNKNAAFYLRDFAAGTADYISLRYSFPMWLAESLIEWLGAERAEAFCAESHRPPLVCARVNTLRTTRAELRALLVSEGMECEESALTDTCLYLRHTSDLTKTEAYRRGRFFVMDEGAELAAAALSARPGQTVLDLCAAPGGKAFSIACHLNNEGTIHATDIREHRLTLLQASAKRLGITCIQTELRDAAAPSPEWLGKADAVLLDEPCSGLGVLRGKPDVKLTRKPEDIARLAAFQSSLLSAAAGYVKDGGVLVYCTCTVAPEENADNVRAFLAREPFALTEPPVRGEASFDTGYGLQLMPCARHDAFFIARMEKLVRQTAC
jgi:16S rRNA (cytosine967-C5)-methyltransferase